MEGKWSNAALLLLICVCILSSCHVLLPSLGVPSNPYPPDGAVDVSLTPTLSWTCYSSDDGTLTYDVYFGTCSPPPLIKCDHNDTTYNPGLLKSGTIYYWKIVAKSQDGKEVHGPIWTFRTDVPIDWQKAFGGVNRDEARNLCLTEDGYIIVGYTYSNDGNVSNNHGDSDWWVVKVDRDGNIQWQKTLGGSGCDKAYSIQKTTDEGYIIVGAAGSSDGDVLEYYGWSDWWVVKIDKYGNIQWRKALGGSKKDCAYSVRQTSDGGYIVVGSTQSSDGDVCGNHGYDDYWVVKLDANGNIQWKKAFGGFDSDIAYSVQQTHDNGYIVAGAAFSNDGNVSGNHGYYDFWIVKLNSNGDLEWQKCFGGSEWDIAQSIQQTSDGGYIVTGYTRSNDGDVSSNYGSYDCWVVRLDEDGNIQWEKTFGGSKDDYAYNIQPTDDGYIIVGCTYSDDQGIPQNNGLCDLWIIKIDKSGNMLWQKTFGGSGEDCAYDVYQSIDGSYIIVGYTHSNDGDVSGNHGYCDFWIVKLK